MKSPAIRHFVADADADGSVGVIKSTQVISSKANRFAFQDVVDLAGLDSIAARRRRPTAAMKSL